MAERASVLERSQIGVEAVPGTAVACGHRLMLTRIEPRPVVAVRHRRGIGSKYGVAAEAGREHTEARLEGEAGYNELVYLLAAHLCTPVFGGSTATFVPDPFGPDTVRTLTVQAGTSARAEQFDYGIVRTLQLRFTGTEVAVTGEMFGRELAEGAALTPNAAPVGTVLIGPGDWKVRVGTAMNGGDLADLTRVLECELLSRNKWKPGFFAGGSGEESFTREVELAPETRVRLALEHDAVSAGFMATLRSAESRLLRIEANGPEVSPGTAYQLRIEMPFRFVECDRGDRDELFGSVYTLEPTYDAAFNGTGGVMKVSVTSGVTGF
ncbi:MAG: hypothetical protein ACK47B_22505 [Armatimonadota bacterium]